LGKERKTAHVQKTASKNTRGVGKMKVTKGGENQQPKTEGSTEIKGQSNRAKKEKVWVIIRKGKEGAWGGKIRKESNPGSPTNPQKNQSHPEKGAAHGKSPDRFRLDVIPTPLLVLTPVGTRRAQYEE